MCMVWNVFVYAHALICVCRMEWVKVAAQVTTRIFRQWVKSYWLFYISPSRFPLSNFKCDAYNIIYFKHTMSNACFVRCEKRIDLDNLDKINIPIILQTEVGGRKAQWVPPTTLLAWYSLLSLIHRYLLRNKKLYVAFIDFRKTFDYISYSKRWPIWEKTGIIGNMFQTIHSM